jgi:hypothetical protein
VEAYTGELETESVDEFDRGSGGRVAGSDCRLVSSGSYEAAVGRWATARRWAPTAGSRVAGAGNRAAAVDRCGSPRECTIG